MAKKYWKSEYEYQRILEILNDYWLEEKNELLVNVQMVFVNADGRKQVKEIMWRNEELWKDHKFPSFVTVIKKKPVLKGERAHNIGYTLKELNEMYSDPIYEDEFWKMNVDEGVDEDEID